MSEEVEISKVLPVENVVAGYWDILRPEVIDTSTTAYDYVEYREDNVTGSATKPFLQIETRDRDSMIYIRDSYLEYRYHNTDQAGATLNRNEVVALQNNPLSLFKDIQYDLEDQKIEFISNCAHAWHIKHISTFGSSFNGKNSSNQHYFLDMSDGAVMPGDVLKFYIDNTATAASERHKKEVKFATNDVDAGQVIVDTALTGAADATTWQQNDDLKAFIGIHPVKFQAKTNAGVLVDLVPMLNGATGILGYRPYTGGAAFAGGDIILVTVGGAPVTFTLNDDFIGLQTTLTFALQKPYLVTSGNQNALGTINGFRSYNAGTSVGGTAVAGLKLKGFCSAFDEFKYGFYERYKQSIKYSVGASATASGTANLAGTPSATSTDGSVSVWVPVRHMFMFAEAFDKVSRGLRHRLILNKETNFINVLLRNNHYGTNTDKVPVIDYISWWVPRLKPDAKTLASVESALISRQQYPINFTDLTCWISQKQQALNGVQNVIQLATQSNKIVKCWVAFQTEERFEGNQTYNKRIYDNMLLSSLQLRLNGQIYPFYEYKFDKNNSDFKYYNRAFNDLMNSAHKMHDDLDSTMINYEMFSALYPVFYFDIQYQPEDLWKPIKYSELEIRYTPNLNKKHYVIIVYESERQLLIEGIGGSMSIVQ